MAQDQTTKLKVSVNFGSRSNSFVGSRSKVLLFNLIFGSRSKLLLKIFTRSKVFKSKNSIFLTFNLVPKVGRSDFGSRSKV